MRSRLCQRGRERDTRLLSRSPRLSLFLSVTYQQRGRSVFVFLFVFAVCLQMQCSEPLSLTSVYSELMYSAQYIHSQWLRDFSDNHVLVVFLSLTVGKNEHTTRVSMGEALYCTLHCFLLMKQQAPFVNFF